MKDNGKHSMIRWLLAALAVVAVAFLCSAHAFQLLLLQGESMSPAYHNLQLLVLDKRQHDYGYGDVVAFRCEQLDSVLVKRVVALPGDSVVIQAKQLLVNGCESCVYPAATVFEYSGLLLTPVVLGEGEFIVIGDNVSRSRDSRYPEVGIIRREQIIGKVLYGKPTIQSKRHRNT